MEGPEEHHWHWDKGIQFALTAMKALLTMNGAAAISMLTFVGNTKTTNTQLVFATGGYAFGALFATVSLIMAYATQLNYGNSYFNNSQQSNLYKYALTFHWMTYITVIAAILSFAISTVLSAYGLALRIPTEVFTTG